jgi:hypothetical protein
MGLHDRTTDREPHPHAILFGREEGLEDTIDVAEPAPGVSNLNSHSAGPIAT